MILYLRAEVFHMLAREVGSIIEEDAMSKLKVTNNVCQTNFTIYCPVTSESGTTSIHLVKKLVATRGT